VISRKLVPAERMVDVFDRASTLNFSIVAQLRGPLERTRLEAGLRALEQRHPLLRARLVREGMRFEAGAPEIPLHEEHGDVQARIAASCDHRVWSDDGPRAELVWFPSASTLMLTLHHLVSDGSSGMLAMRDLLRLMAAPSHERVPSPGLNVLLPTGHGGLRDKLGTAGMFARAMFKKPHRLGDYRHDFEARRARVHRLRLDAASSTQLRQRAKREGATVHGVLCGALALGVATQVPRAHLQRIVHPVDLRRYTRGASVGEAVGYYVSSVDSDHAVARDTALPALAREISTRVADKKRHGEPLLTAPLAGPLLAARGANMESARFRELAERKLLRNTFSLTNLGPLETLDVDSRYGDLELQDLYFVAAGSVLSTLGAAASTYRGELSLLVGGVTPILPEASVRDISEHAFARLRDYATGK
jgi:hypothetical protein